MMYLNWLFQFALMVAVTFLTPVIMLFAVWFQNPATGRMPRLLRFLETYDDLGPGQGMYEPAVAAIYNRFGWRVKQWYWLGIRNQCYTLFFWLAPEIDWRHDAYVSKGRRGDPSWMALVYQADGWRYFERGWSWQYSATKGGSFGFGWKIFSIDRFFTTGAIGTSNDRPLFYFQLKPYSTLR